MRVLSEAGITGIVVDIGGEAANDLVAGLRRMINGIPAPVRKHRRAEAMVPRVTQETVAVDDNLEEEDGFD